MRFRIISTFLLLCCTSFLIAQSTSKKTKNFTVSRVIPVSAEKVWKAIGEDYGYIANAHPKIHYSDYVEGTLKGGEGAKRVCHFNKKGTRVLYEEIKDWKPEEMEFTNTIYEFSKFPIDKHNTFAVYKVKSLGPDQSEVSLDFTYRTKPAFMSGMVKGSFKKLINNYFIALEHHLTTGEVVNATTGNFKTIKQKYRKNQPLAGG